MSTNERPTGEREQSWGRWWHALALALPILAVALAIARAELRRARADHWGFAINGYDPRDLLRGRYLRFTIDSGEDDATSALQCSDTDSDCCLCLSGVPGEGYAHTRRTSCDRAMSECQGAVRMEALRRVNRFYVPEARAAELEQALLRARRNGTARVVLAIDAEGGAEIEALELEGVRIE